jgi:mRNA interferase RelE/StbE
MPYEIRYHPDVKSIDIPSIESRLMSAPHQYGEPLRKTLKGYWKLRIGDYRIVFKIHGNTVLILGIIHRKDIYKKVVARK